MNLTAEQIKVLADVVEFPLDWVENTLKALGPEAGEQAVLDKIVKHAPRSIQRQAKYGDDYLTRAQRLERERARLKQMHDDMLAELEAKAEAERKAQRDLIRDVVLEVLAEREIGRRP